MLKVLHRSLIPLSFLVLFQPSVNADSSESPAQLLENSDSVQHKPIQLAAAIGSSVIIKKPIINKLSPDIIFDEEKNLRLLELHIGKYNLKELIAAYQYQDMILVPLGFLSELIDLAITVDRGNNTADGFIFREDRTFNLDIERSEVTISGKLSHFDPDRIAIRELDDIYIDSRLLSKWLSLKIDIDLFQSQIKIISDEPLPFEKRKLREERIKYARSRKVMVRLRLF